MDQAVNEVTSPLKGYSAHHKDLNAEDVSDFGVGVSVARPHVSSASALVMVVRKRRTPVRSPALAANQNPWVRRVSAMRQRALLSLRSSSMPLIARLFGIRLPSGRRRE
jgi:hypothetical protein